MSDPITLGLASTTVGLVNGTITLLKQAREAAKSSHDSDLKDKLSDVYNAVLEMRELIGNLTEENANLKKRLEAKANLKWDTKMKVYLADDDPDPFCPVCLDSNGQQIRLHPGVSHGRTWKYDCKVCHAHFLLS